MKKSEQIIEGIIVDDSMVFTLTQIIEASGLQSNVIIEMIEHGLIQPLAKNETQHFSAKALLRIRSAQRLHQDLGVNIQGAALAFDLMDELEEMRNELKRLRELLHR